METIKEISEFTWDMVRGLPQAYYFKQKEGEVKVVCHKNLDFFYWFADEIEISNDLSKTDCQDTFLHEGPEWSKSKWAPPPLKDYFKKQSVDFFRRNNIKLTKPLVVINNKCTIEWGLRVFTYFDLDFLDEIINLLKPKFDIAYIRPSEQSEGYFFDHNAVAKFKDHDFVKNNHPEVFLVNEYGDNFNLSQCCFQAHSDKHISVSGGNACLSSYFASEVLIYDNSPDPKRGSWKTNSWLKKLSGANIYGHTTYEHILKHVIEQWL